MPEPDPQAAALARFAVRARADQISPEAREAIRIRTLDALGCALGALGAEPLARVRRYAHAVGGRPLATVLGGERTSPDRAALVNGFAVRYLDFNDSYLAPGETCHPSDSLAAVLAAAEHAGASGEDLIAAQAVAYQVQCRLSDEAPVRHRGFDHTVQLAYAVAAGVARALGMDEHAAAHAIAIAGTAFNALRVTRTGSLSNWKGLAAPNAAFCATHAAYLAREGITGPPEIFEGVSGFEDAIAGRFTIDWEREDLERVRRTIVKRYNAEIHAQSALAALEDLRGDLGAAAREVARVDIETFDVAHDIIGGGREGDKLSISTKEQADHSLPYMAAAMILDGEVTPRQYTPDRIAADDVQALMRRIRVTPSADLSRRFPDELPCRVTVTMTGGATHAREVRDYEGFHTRPIGWDGALAKFRDLAHGAPEAAVDAIAGAVRDLEQTGAADLAGRLAGARG